MLKGLFRFIGVVVVIIILIMALLFYLDGKGLLFGRLGNLVHTLRVLGSEAWIAVSTFSAETGIVDDAAHLLGEGVDMFHSVVDPHPATASPNPYLSATPIVDTPWPTITPAVDTPMPTITPTPMPTITPVP